MAAGVTLAVVALGIGGVIALRGVRPSDVVGGPAVTGVLDVPVVASGDQSLGGAAGLDPRVAGARTRLADAVEAGKAIHAQASARSAASPAELLSLRGALDAGLAALAVRPPGGDSPERTVAYLESLDACRSAILDAASTIADVWQVLAGQAAQRRTSAHGSGGATAATETGPDEGGASGGGTGTAGSGGGETTDVGSDGGSTDTTSGGGSAGGGTATPTATAPAPTVEPTPQPSAEPTPEPTPDPTPGPTTSPTTTPEPTGAPSSS